MSLGSQFWAEFRILQGLAASLLVMSAYLSYKTIQILRTLRGGDQSD